MNNLHIFHNSQGNWKLGRQIIVLFVRPGNWEATVYLRTLRVYESSAAQTRCNRIRLPTHNVSEYSEHLCNL